MKYLLILCLGFTAFGQTPAINKPHDGDSGGPYIHLWGCHPEAGEGYHICRSTGGMSNPSDEGHGCKPTGGDDCTPRYSYDPQIHNYSNATWVANLPSPTSPRITVLPEYKDAVEVQSKDGTSIVRMKEEEYTHLKALRQAVVDEEKRLAVAYGAREADPGEPCYVSTCGSVWPKYQPADLYEFHGQFILIQKMDKK